MQVELIKQTYLLDKRNRGVAILVDNFCKQTTEYARDLHFISQKLREIDKEFAAEIAVVSGRSADADNKIRDLISVEYKTTLKLILKSLNDRFTNIEKKRLEKNSLMNFGCDARVIYLSVSRPLPPSPSP